MDKLRKAAPGLYLLILYLNKGLRDSNNLDDLDEVLTPKVRKYLKEIGTPPEIIRYLIMKDPKNYLQA